jgi:hypothetical protein
MQIHRRTTVAAAIALIIAILVGPAPPAAAVSTLGPCTYDALDPTENKNVAGGWLGAIDLQVRPKATVRCSSARYVQAQIQLLGRDSDADRQIGPTLTTSSTPRSRVGAATVTYSHAWLSCDEDPKKMDRDEFYVRARIRTNTTGRFTASGSWSAWDVSRVVIMGCKS